MLTVIGTHPLVAQSLTVMRTKGVSPERFRREMNRVGLHLAMRATQDLLTRIIPIETPLAHTEGAVLDKPTALAIIMRAANGLFNAFEEFLPKSLIWHLNISRDHTTHQPIFRSSTVPKRVSPRRRVLVLDPMLATAGSACYAITHLKEAGAKDIAFVGVLGCIEGVTRLAREHPDVPIFLADVDPDLNENAYIVPGLGDAGDLCYPTEETLDLD